VKAGGVTHRSTYAFNAYVRTSWYLYWIVEYGVRRQIEARTQMQDAGDCLSGSEKSELQSPDRLREYIDSSAAVQLKDKTIPRFIKMHIS